MRLVKIYIIVLCWFCKTSIAQFYFNNRYDNFNSCDVGGNLSSFPTYYINTGFTCNAFTYYALNLIKIQLDGTSLLTKTYYRGGNNFSSNIGSNVIMSNNDFIIGGARHYKTDTSLVFLWRFNSNLDSIKYSEFGYLNKNNRIDGIVRNANYIYMVGGVDSLYKNADILLVKADTLGNEIWKKRIGLAGWDENGYSIKISSDGKLLISGDKRVHNVWSTNGAYLLKVDTSGAIIWQQYFSSNGGMPATALIELPNTDILAIAAKGYGNNTRLELIKLDSSGNLIYDKVYGSFTDNIVPYSMILNNHGNLVAAGQNYYPTVGGKVNGLMYEFNQNGDSLFSREYAIQPGSQNYFRDVVQAPDKGYCFSGFISPLFANGGTGTQDIWLLKTDSTFCESAVSCGYPTSVRDISYGSESVSVYPNPTNSIINLTDEQNQLQSATIVIKNYLGQIVFTAPFSSQIDISSLSSGMYFLTVQDKSNKRTVKVVKD